MVSKLKLYIIIAVILVVFNSYMFLKYPVKEGHNCRDGVTGFEIKNIT